MLRFSWPLRCGQPFTAGACPLSLQRACYELSGSKHSNSKRLHVAVWYIPGPQRGHDSLTLKFVHAPHRYLDPLGREVSTTSHNNNSQYINPTYPAFGYFGPFRSLEVILHLFQ